MANVMHHIEFNPRPVSHAPSPFGFGFGLGATMSSSLTAGGWQATTTPGHTNPSAFHQLASSVQQYSNARAQKRRHDSDDDVEIGKHSGLRDESMDRSPTPERLKRAPPKRARVAPTMDASTKVEITSKENKAPDTEGNEIDVGLLLASLPSQSLLPLLTSLLNAQPSLKSTILPLIPRPTIDTATQALAQSAKKLRDAYPYSASSQIGPSGLTGFGKYPSQNMPAFGSANHHNGGMRDSYITSRLRPFITEFVAAFSSYLPYFTSVSTRTSSLQSISTQNDQHTRSHSTTLQSTQRERPHPSETFLFLSAVTNHMLSQAHLTQASLVPLIISRLSEEWNAWVCRVDEVVNREGGMFGSETVRTWERTLDELAEAKGFDNTNPMRDVRDLWISKVGWLTGRTVHQQMDEL